MQAQVRRTTTHQKRVSPFSSFYPFLLPPPPLPLLVLHLPLLLFFGLAQAQLSFVLLFLGLAQAQMSFVLLFLGLAQAQLRFVLCLVQAQVEQKALQLVNMNMIGWKHLSLSQADPGFPLEGSWGFPCSLGPGSWTLSFCHGLFQALWSEFFHFCLVQAFAFFLLVCHQLTNKLPWPFRQEVSSLF